MKERRMMLVDGPCPACGEQTLYLVTWQVRNDLMQQVRCAACDYRGPDSRVQLSKDHSPVVIVVPMTEAGALVTVFLTDKGICGEVVTRLTAEKARGAHVVFYGSSPNLLALTSAAKVTEVLFDRPEGGWRKNLSIKELEAVFRGFRSYRVTRL